MFEKTYRANDVRGQEEELTDEFCQIAAQAYIKLLSKYRKKNPEDIKIGVGKDVRLSSPRIQRSFIEGAILSGATVIDLASSNRATSTPLVYFATWLLDTDGGVEVTGSHLAKEWNGLKFTIGSASTTEYQMNEMRDLAYKIKEEGLEKRGDGKIIKKNVVADYREMVKLNALLGRRWADIIKKVKKGDIRLKEAIEIGKNETKNKNKTPLEGIKVVFDAGNGTTGLIAPKIFRDLGADVIELYCEPDGNFPHHIPDPTIQRYLEDLKEVVMKNEAHVGLSSDCDGDRVGAVSPRGELLIGERILALLIKKILKENAGAKIVYDIKCSDVIREIILENGGIPIEWKVGFSFIKDKMEEEGAVAGGEMSGHIYYKKNNGVDDAVFAFIEFLLILADNKERTLDQILNELPKYENTPEIRIPTVNDDEKERINTEIVNYLKKMAEKYPKKYGIRNDIDGVKIDFKNHKGWVSVRQSNTSPAISVRAEAKTKDGLKKIENELFPLFTVYDSLDLNTDDYLREALARIKKEANKG
ncbi:MAG: phosphomannomutase/phosphoglucomutase [Methanophagales archaeon]|nr:phosphomannomutase/phosphoglucomutase [Methanophagales archaeon]